MHNEIIDFEDAISEATKKVAKIPAVKSQINNLISQTGLPPETFSFAYGILKGDGSIGDKIKDVTKVANGMLNQLLGPAGQVGDLITTPIMSALGIEDSAVGQVAGALGKGIGTILLGPAGGAIGGFLAETVGGAIADILTTTPKEREAKRRDDDIKRINAFAVGQKLTPLDKSHHWKKDLTKWYVLFRNGKILISRGAEGGKTQKYWIQNNKLVAVPADVYGKNMNAWRLPNPSMLDITSASMTGRFLAAMSPVEAKAVQVKNATEALQVAHAKDTKFNSLVSAVQKLNTKVGQLKMPSVAKQTDDHVILGKLITSSAVLGKENNAAISALSKQNSAAISALSKKIDNTTVIPKSMQNILGGQGLFDLIKKS